MGIATDEPWLWAYICIKCPIIAQDRFRKQNVVTLGLQMPILCYGSKPPVSNRVYALTSVVLPVHSLGVSNAYSRGLSPMDKIALTSDPSAGIPIASAQHSLEWTLSVHSNHLCSITLVVGAVLPSNRPPRGAARRFTLLPLCSDLS